jgi:hypothetical protein
VQEEVRVDQLLGDVADHHRARVGDLLDPRCEIGHQADDRVPLGDGAVVAQVADHDAAGVDPDPDLECHTEPVAQLCTGVAQCHDEVQAGEYRSPGVVLVGGRVAEAGEDAVAGVVHQGAAVPADGLPGRRAVDGEQVAQLLGLDLLGQRRGADQVGEEQGHQCPFP